MAEELSELSKIARKIERINILHTLVGTAFLNSENGGDLRVVKELNDEIDAFLLNLLNIELGIVTVKASGPDSSSLKFTPEQTQALEWLLERLLGAVNAPAPSKPLQPVGNPNLAEGVEDPDPFGMKALATTEPPPANIESIHVRPPTTAVSKGSKRGSGIMEILKAQNPALVTPRDPGFAELSPLDKAAAQAEFEAAVRLAEAKAKARVGG